MILRKLIRFLGGLYCAIGLIALTALFVTAGTLIESFTQSHRYAELWAYRNPIFIALLGGFFLNILLSALRRWPFKKQHIPFLITHLGLLLMLSGVFVKNLFGTQGDMLLLEGSGSNSLVLPNTYAILLESRKSVLTQVALSDVKSPKTFSLADTNFQLLSFYPNAKEKHETWIQQDNAYLGRGNKIPVQDWSSWKPGTALQGEERVLLEDNGNKWLVFAGRTKSPTDVLKEIYHQGTTIRLADAREGTRLFEGSLKEALAGPVLWKGGQAFLDLQWTDLKEPVLTIVLEFKDRSRESVQIPLSGHESLIHKNLTTPYFGTAPIAVDFERQATIILVESQDKQSFWVLDPHGRIYEESFNPEMAEALYAYDGGFAGYGVRLKVPTSADSKLCRAAQDQNRLALLKQQLQQGVSNARTMIPPLQLMQEACYRTNTNFVDILTGFLEKWDKGHSWLYSDQVPLDAELSEVLLSLDWTKIPKDEYCGAVWTTQLFNGLEPALKQGVDLWTLLEKQGWPLMAQLAEVTNDQIKCDPENTGTLLTKLTQQLFSVAGQLPIPPQPQGTAFSQARLLSAYLRSYDIHLSGLLPNKAESIDIGFLLECQLTHRYEQLPSNTKLEDNVPSINIRVQKGSLVDWVNLGYDRSGLGLRWPILGGEYLAKFQAEHKKIPYRVRLRTARQVNYANSSQPFSYESDLWITDLNANKVVEAKLQMNHVYETWDGYRFYLANVTPSDEKAAKHVHLVVNHDPAKYWLTYPGALLVALGIFLLFWFSAKKLT